MAHTQHWSAGLESWMIDVPCVRREIHARSTHPQVPVKRHRGRRDTRTHGSHRRTSQPSLTTIPTHNRTQARPRDDRRARSRPNLGRDARIATNQKPPHTTHPKKTGGSRVTSTGKKTGGTGEPGHTHNSSKSARKPNRFLPAGNFSPVGQTSKDTNQFERPRCERRGLSKTRLEHWARGELSGNFPGPHLSQDLSFRNTLFEGELARELD